MTKQTIEACELLDVDMPYRVILAHARFYDYPGYRPDEGQGTNPRGGIYERRDGRRVGVRLSGNPDHRHPGP